MAPKRDAVTGKEEPEVDERAVARGLTSDIPAFVKVRERPLKTHVHGRGGTVFLCPTGWGLPGELALNLFRAYGDMARFFTFDPSGTGESTGLRSKEDLGSRGIANDSSGMLLRLKMRPLAVMGHSHGGCSALRVAINHPELVRRLVVVCTTPGDGTADAWNWRAVLGEGAPREPLASREQLLGVTRLIMINALGDPRSVDQSFAGIEGRAWNVAVERFNALAKDGRFLDLRGKMRHIAAPTLIMAGGKDPLIDLEAAEAMRAEIPKSELVVFERSGHFPMLEEPEKFRTVLSEFFERD